ncbi:MAG: hypothetical protein AB8F74_06440, partial [Saprospiraceae bacterium]
MKRIKLLITATGLLILFISCGNKNHGTNDVNKEKSSKESRSILSPIENKLKKSYLKEAELKEFLAKVKGLKFESDYPTPFDSLTFDRVIAYDFDGMEEMNPSVINRRYNRYASVI